MRQEKKNYIIYYRIKVFFIQIQKFFVVTNSKKRKHFFFCYNINHSKTNFRKKNYSSVVNLEIWLSYLSFWSLSKKSISYKNIVNIKLNIFKKNNWWSPGIFAGGTVFEIIIWYDDCNQKFDMLKINKKFSLNNLF